MHAGGVDDLFVVGDGRIVAGDGSHGVEKQTVAELHDVRLMNRRHLLPPMTLSVVEGETPDTCRSSLGDDFQALDDAGNDLMLEPGVEVFGVLADDHDVDAREPCRHARKIPDWAK